jgi:NarL family two-component system response regulator LiaR
MTQASTGSGGRAIRVLIADDHAIVRNGIRALLETEDDILVAGEAGDGVEAVAQAAALQPDVVLMDLMMPKQDGVEATRQIVARGGGTRILVLTSFVADDKVYPAIKAGALGFLLKDTGPGELVNTIRQVHLGAPALDPSIARKILAELSQPAKAPPAEDPLTGREMSVVRLAAQGRAPGEIAARLAAPEADVRAIASDVLAKLCLAERSGTALRALAE